MNKYTIPNFFKFKNKRRISALTVAEYRNKNKGYAILVSDRYVDAGRIVSDNLRYVSDVNKNKFFAEKNDGTLVLADSFTGDCADVVMEKNVTEQTPKQGCVGYKIPEGYLIKDNNLGDSHIIYENKVNDQFSSKSWITEGYKHISAVSSENGLRKVVPSMLFDKIIQIGNDFYYYIDKQGNKKSCYIKEESDVDANGNKIVVGYNNYSETVKAFLTNKDYIVNSYEYDKIIAVGDKYIATSYVQSKNNLGINAKAAANVILDHDGCELTRAFTKYYTLANGDFLIRPLGMNNYKLIDGISFKVKENNINNPIVCEKLDIFYAKQNGVPTIFGYNGKINKNVNHAVSIAVMNKLNNKRIPSKIIDYIIENQINIDPTLDMFVDQLNFNRIMRSDDEAIKYACEKSMKDVRNSLYATTKQRLKKYSQQIKLINQTSELTEKFKVALGKSKYVRQKREPKELYTQLEIEIPNPVDELE